MKEVYTRKEAFETIYSDMKLSDAELIRRTGISRQMLYKWKKGTATVRPYHLISLVNAVGKAVLWKDKNHEKCSLISSGEYDMLIEKDGEYVVADMKTFTHSPKNYQVSMHSDGDWVFSMIFDTATGKILSKKRYKTHDFEYEESS